MTVTDKKTRDTFVVLPIDVLKESTYSFSVFQNAETHARSYAEI